jgi:hypothetical protein
MPDSFPARSLKLVYPRQSTTEIYVEGNDTDTKDALKLLELEKLEKFQKV